jgi:choline dehydrogenase-like flavoprotein
MGISPNNSVVKPTGETWEVKNLYVADASVFPTSSGVNPMVTTETIALHIADCIIDDSKSKL